MDEVIAKVISQKGTCSARHKVGDEFIINEITPEGMCAWAYYTLYPFSTVLRFGGSFPWESDAGKSVVACPDAENPVRFELRRSKKS
jgi:uncharacterized repeat protein (TIGR04076 family)